MDSKDFMNKKYSYAILVVSGTVIISLLLIGVVVYPLYKSASAVTIEANQKSEELTQLKNKKKILDNLKSREEELKNAAEKVSSALPSGRDVGSLFIQVNSLAKDSGGTVSSVSGSSTGSATTSASDTGFSGIQKYSFTIPASFNNYFSLKNFVNSSNSALRLVNIDSITINSQDGGKVDSNITITTYARN